MGLNKGIDYQAFNRIINAIAKNDDMKLKTLKLNFRYTNINKKIIDPLEYYLGAPAARELRDLNLHLSETDLRPSDEENLAGVLKNFTKCDKIVYN